MKIKKGILKDNEYSFETLEVNLPKTTLLIIEGNKCFAMCGALNVDIYNTEKMVNRGVVCMQAIGVKNINELYNAKVNNCNKVALEYGITKDMLIKDAIKEMASK